MPAIHYEGNVFPLAENESVLDALLRNGVLAPHSCKAGSCGSCLMRAFEGSIPARAQQGLKESWKAQGYFLPCVCHPASDLSIRAVDASEQVGASIAALDRLSDDVMRVRLQCDAPLEFHAGQYVTVVRENGLARSYSIASLPDAPQLELHVRRVATGRMSAWLHEQARPGDRVSLRGPFGECFYVPGKEDQPLLLVGTGTGLAPLYGVLQDALRHGHRGPIHLVHGALHRRGLYLVDDLRRLGEHHTHFGYVPTVLNGTSSEGLTVGAIDQVVLERFPKLNGWRGFVCGDPDVVKSLKKRLFLSGMASREIHADAFLPSAQAAS